MSRGVSLATGALRVALGLVLVRAGIAKVSAPDWWRDSVTKMDLFAIDAVGPLSSGLAGVELIVGLALIAGLWRRSSALLSTLLFLGFALLLLVLLRRDVPTTCGCFGPEDEFIVDGVHVVLDLAAAALAGLLTFLPGTAFEFTGFRRERAPSDSACVSP